MPRLTFQRMSGARKLQDVKCARVGLALDSFQPVPDDRLEGKMLFKEKPPVSSRRLFLGGDFEVLERDTVIALRVIDHRSCREID